MAEKLERKVMEIYGENAATRDIIAYGSDIAGNIVKTKDPDVIQTEAYKTGVRSAVVGKNSTSLQNRQALDFLFSRQLKYLYQHGVAEWGASETYFVNSFAVGSDGNLYVSLTDNNKGNDPVTDTTNWQAFPTPAQLAQKVAKAGDTMTGPLKMLGQNVVRFGTDDNFYYIRSDENNGNFLIYANNNTGLYLGGNEQHTPYYWNGTQSLRLLTTADLPGADSTTIGFPNTTAGISITLPYTATSNGWICCTWNSDNAASSGALAIDGVNVFYHHSASRDGRDSYWGSTALIPIKTGQVVTSTGTVPPNGNKLFFPFKNY